MKAILNAHQVPELRFCRAWNMVCEHGKGERTDITEKSKKLWPARMVPRRGQLHMFVPSTSGGDSGLS